MHKAILAFTIYFACIANKFQLSIGLENSRDQCSNTKTKTVEFRSRDRDCDLEDYKSAVELEMYLS